MIRATLDDRSAITAFLTAHLPVAFYPLTNLIQHGMGTDHPSAMRFWIRRDGDQLTDVLGLTAAGFLYPVLTTDVTGTVAGLLAGDRVLGYSGAPDDVSALRRAFAITTKPNLDFTEPVYRLALDQLIMPKGTGLSLRPLTAVPVTLLTSWRASFLIETQANMVAMAVQRAMSDIDAIIGRDTYRVLFDGDKPVAMTGFNAVLSDVVQVGGVFVPRQSRSRGYGRAAVALHLQQARADGVRHAYLNAATTAAARAYEAIGFRRHGAYAAIVYEEGQMIDG